jgi:hypothetical protein
MASDADAVRLRVGRQAAEFGLSADRIATL